MNGHNPPAGRSTPDRRGARPVSPNVSIESASPTGVDAAGHCLTAFFIPGLETDAAGAERFYDALRDEAEAGSGSVAHKRRIFRVACRRQGADQTIEVGDTAAVAGRTVIAILQVGREAYTIHCKDADDPSTLSMIEISRRTVYAVTDFD
jgi:hypothetical protein